MAGEIGAHAVELATTLLSDGDIVLCGETNMGMGIVARAPQSRNVAT